MGKSKFNPNNRCGKCSGIGLLERTLVACEAVEAGELCTDSDHFQHFWYDRACWLCLGSGLADVFTIIWRKLRNGL